MGRCQGCLLSILARFTECSTKLRVNQPKIKGVVNFLIMFLVGIPVLLFVAFGEPYQRGFYCSDTSLSYPKLPDTVSLSAVIIIGLFIPIVTILIVETVNDPSPISEIREEHYKLFCVPRILSIGTMIGYFLFGCGCIQTLTDVSKYSIGRLRPHFHAVCDTNWTSIKTNCSVMDPPQAPQYIFPIPCKNDNHEEIRKARLSFWSGHASFSSFTMIYVIIYLQHRLISEQATLLKPFMQFLCLLFTVYTCLSRVFDYHHHPSEALTGFLMGTFVAYMVSRYVSGLVGSNGSQHQNCAIHHAQGDQVVITATPGSIRRDTEHTLSRQTVASTLSYSPTEQNVNRLNPSYEHV